MIIRDVAYTYWTVKGDSPTTYLLFIAIYTNAGNIKVEKPYSIGEKTVLEITLQDPLNTLKTIAKSIPIELRDQVL